MSSCRVCGVQTSKRCSACRQAYYCTRQHIRQDWKRHKRECGVVVDGASKSINENSSTSSIQSKSTGECDAILLPFDSIAPRFIKLRYEIDEDDEEEGVEYHRQNGSLDQWIKAPGTSTQLEWYPFSPRSLPYSISLHYCDTGLLDGLPANVCIHSMMGNELRQTRWVGNLVVTRLKKPTETLLQYQSAKMEDLQYVKDYFGWYENAWKDSGGGN